MPLMKGHSPGVVSSNIKEMVRAGHKPVQAIAAALASARKYKKMASGGMVDIDDDADAGTDNAEDAQRSLGEIQAQGRSLPDSIANPELEEHSDDLAKALFKKSQEHDMLSFAEGGLIEGEEDMEDGNEPTIEMAADTDEPVSVMPSKPEAGHEEMGMTEAMKQAIADKKKRRRFVQMV